MGDLDTLVKEARGALEVLGRMWPHNHHHPEETAEALDHIRHVGHAIDTLAQRVREAEGSCVTCEDCGFRYGAEHMNEDGKTYTCPLCELQDAEAKLKGKTFPAQHICTICGTAIDGPFVGDGTGQRFAHRYCYEMRAKLARYREAMEDVRATLNRDDLCGGTTHLYELKQRLRALSDEEES